jgi:hypothetical protein
VSSKQEVVANGHLQVIGEVRNRRCRGFWWDADGKPLRFADAGEAWLLMVVRAVLGMLAPAAGSKRTRAGRSSARRSATRASVAAERSPAADEIQKVGAPGGALLLGHLEAGALEREAETIEDRPAQVRRPRWSKPPPSVDEKKSRLRSGLRKTERQLVASHALA